MRSGMLFLLMALCAKIRHFNKALPCSAWADRTMSLMWQLYDIDEWSSYVTGVQVVRMGLLVNVAKVKRSDMPSD